MKTICIYGPHVIQAALDYQPQHLLKIYLSTYDLLPDIHRDIVQQYGIKIEKVSTTVLTKLSQSEHHQGIIADFKQAASHQEAFYEHLETIAPAAGLIIALDRIEDPHNLGAIFRTAAAFGVHAIVASTHQSVSLTATVYKVSQGGIFKVPFFQVVNISRMLNYLPSEYWRIGTSSHTEDTLKNTNLTRPLVWVLGSESQGLKPLVKKNCDQLIRIDMAKNTESLNVSVATGICLYETYRQRLK